MVSAEFGRKYNGTENMTISGEPCQTWPDSNNNYCRNPKDPKKQDWCFAKSPTKKDFDYCAVVTCGKYIKFI